MEHPKDKKPDLLKGGKTRKPFNRLEISGKRTSH
jgi:hypothetical protein